MRKIWINTFKGILTMMLIISSFFACEKTSNGIIQQNINGAFIDKEAMDKADSLSYSFAIHPEGLQQDTLWIPIAISGEPANIDRKIPIKVIADKTTAKADLEYVLLSTTMPKGLYRAKLPLLIKKSDRIKTEEVRLFFDVGSNTDFPLEITQTKINATQNSGSEIKFSKGFLIKFSNIFQMPDGWDDNDSYFRFYFGSYSDVKWRFILQVTGRTDWGYKARYGVGSPGNDKLRIYRAQVMYSLQNYEEANGPLLDEFGNKVSF